MSKKDVPDGAGDVWTWLAMDSKSRLLLSYLVDDRSWKSAKKFIKDLSGRVLNTQRLEICTDGNEAYVKPIKKYFGEDIPYYQLVKDYRGDQVTVRVRKVSGKHVLDKASTSHIERVNLTCRQHMKRYTRSTNGFSKTIKNHRNSVDIFIAYYNWIKVHQTLGTTPAIAAGLAKKPCSLEWMVKMID